MSLTEWLNFDFQEYKKEVISFIKKDDFAHLKAANKGELALGKLDQQQINRLKNVMVNSFEKDSTIREIAEELDKIGLSDRSFITKNGKIQLKLKAQDRGITLARTESTRVAAEGVLIHYEKKDVEQVRWLASISERTCPICIGNDGLIFSLNEARGQIPAHTGCRCIWLNI